jgi:hypothetical protein
MSEEHKGKDVIPIDLHSTGMSANPDIIPSVGDIDPYWTVALGPVGFEGGPARVVAVNSDEDEKGAKAAWIWIQPNGGGAYPYQTYSFRNSFDLTSFVAEEVEIHFEVKIQNVVPFAVAVNGQIIEPDDSTVPVDKSRYSYKLKCGSLQKALNIIDILVRVEEDPTSHPAKIKVKFKPAHGRFEINRAKCGPCSFRMLGETKTTSVMARIEPPTSPGHSFQDMAISLDPPVVLKDKLTVSAQIVTLDPDNSLSIPVGAENVYGNNTDPQSMLTVRVLGFSEDGSQIYLRIWSHPLTTSFSSPATGHRSPVGDPPAWPTNSGVVVVVADSGGGPPIA